MVGEAVAWCLLAFFLARGSGSGHFFSRDCNVSSGETYRYLQCGGMERNPKAQIRRESLEGVTLRIGILEGGDYEYDCTGVIVNGRAKLIESYSHFILGLLQEVLGFKTELVSATSWGSFDESTGSWCGLAGLAANNLTDLTICHWTTRDSLLGITDYLLATFETTEAFVYLPQNLPMTQDVFVGTFSRKLWLFFFLSIIFTIVSFKFSTWMHSCVRPDHEPWSWDEVVLWAVAAITQQSYSRHPRGSSCRTMFLIGYTIAYLIYTGFAAGITSLLALQSHQNQLTFADVSDMKLKLLLNHDEYYLDLLKQSPSSKFLSKLKYDVEHNLSQIFSEISHGDFVGFGSTVTLLNYLRTKVDENKRKDVVVFPVPYSKRQKSFLVRKNLPYKNVLNYWLVRLMENGLLDLGKKRFLKAKEAAYYKSTRWLSAGLGNVSSALVFLTGGWALSVLILGAEILWKKRTRSKRKILPSRLNRRGAATDSGLVLNK